MKLITLNIWGGCLKNQLLRFIHQQREVDIFCLQELYFNAHRRISDKQREICLNIFADIKNLLPDHVAIFKPAVENIYGIGMFIKKNIDIIGEGEIIIHEKQHYPGIGINHDRNLQWIECSDGNTIFSVLNVHGLWNGNGKKDTPERIAQSERIRQFMDTINTPKIVCGDFNLRPDTQSLGILEKDMINLIKKHKIRSTRTQYYPKDEKFADYILISDGVISKNFAVLNDEVSDHSPLLLEFDIL